MQGSSFFFKNYMYIFALCYSHVLSCMHLQCACSPGLMVSECAVPMRWTNRGSYKRRGNISECCTGIIICTLIPRPFLLAWEWEQCMYMYVYLGEGVITLKLLCTCMYATLWVEHTWCCARQVTLLWYGIGLCGVKWSGILWLEWGGSLMCLRSARNTLPASSCSCSKNRTQI